MAFTETYDAVNTLLDATEVDALSRTKFNLGVADENTDRDKQITALINEASDAINTQTFRELRKRTSTEFHTGDGTNILIPDQYPIVSITTLHDDLGRVYDAGTLIDNGDLVIMENRNKQTIRRDGSRFLNGFAHGGNNLKLIYVVGLDPIPTDLRRACLDLIKYWWQNTEENRANITTRSAGDGNISVEVEDWPKYVTRTVERYTRKFL